jgi:GTP 3',8-cyclase
MPQEGMIWKKRHELLSSDEIVRVAKIFVALGIDKIRLTGGEPLVRNELLEIVWELSRLKGLKTIAMTTNATLLANKAQALREAGLTALNISLDTFRNDRFFAISRRHDLDKVLAGIDAALKAGFSSLKLNMVVMAKVNDDEILDFVEFAKDKPLNVRFIEYMPFKDNQWTGQKVVTYAEMLELIGSKYELAPIQTEPFAVAKDFQIVGHRGSVSFITSMSDSFCGTCNRLRLTADGSIKSCLFSPAEINFKQELRSGLPADEIDRRVERHIMYALAQKPEAHPPAEEIAANENRAMIEIGG